VANDSEREHELAAADKRETEERSTAHYLRVIQIALMKQGLSAGCDGDGALIELTDRCHYIQGGRQTPP
jgi:hypothetical protein